MIQFFTWPLAPLITAVFTAYFWHKRRKSLGLPVRKLDYTRAFIDGGVLYVLAVILMFHQGLRTSYSDLLSQGFGDEQLTVAFVAAFFEALFSLLAIFSGEDGDDPAP